MNQSQMKFQKELHINTNRMWDKNAGIICLQTTREARALPVCPIENFSDSRDLLLHIVNGHIECLVMRNSKIK